MEQAIRTWRVRERARLKQERLQLSSVDRAFLTEAVVRNLEMAIAGQSPKSVGLYWPIQGEFDLREWAGRVAARKGWSVALPVVVAKQAPLEYWRWRPGDPMTRGFWGILVPERREPVTPDAVIAPLVGFSGLYRLGHGGGYFDRTLAATQPMPYAVGVGAESSRVDGFLPQPHDIPMNAIVTEAAIYREPTAAGSGA
jgi:5-formyltetrahydrofolate cyclo-ligase